MKINMKKTKDYYLSEKSEPCECIDCQNYVTQIKQKNSNIASYLASMNIDVLRPFELLSVDVSDSEIEYLLCQYIVYGSCEDDYSTCIDNISFGKSNCHPPTNIKEEHFILEFGPIILDRI